MRPPRVTLLTPQQLRVLRYASLGMENAAIAREMRLSVETIRTHLRLAYKALGARDRAHAVRLGFDRQILTVERAQ